MWGGSAKTCSLKHLNSNTICDFWVFSWKARSWIIRMCEQSNFFDDQSDEKLHGGHDCVPPHQPTSTHLVAQGSISLSCKRRHVFKRFVYSFVYILTLWYYLNDSGNAVQMRAVLENVTKWTQRRFHKGCSKPAPSGRYQVYHQRCSYVHIIGIRGYTTRSLENKNHTHQFIALPEKINGSMHS